MDVGLGLLLRTGATSSKGSLRTAEFAPPWRGPPPSRLSRGDDDDDDRTGGPSLPAGDARCSIFLSFGSSGETVDRVGARTATDDRGGGGDGGGAAVADVAVADGIGAESVALRRGGGLKISSSNDSERTTRFRFVFGGAGLDLGVVAAVCDGDAPPPGAAAAAASGTTGDDGGGGGCW